MLLLLPAERTSWPRRRIRIKGPRQNVTHRWPIVASTDAWKRSIADGRFQCRELSEKSSGNGSGLEVACAEFPEREPWCNGNRILAVLDMEFRRGGHRDERRRRVLMDEPDRRGDRRASGVVQSRG